MRLGEMTDLGLQRLAEFALAEGPGTPQAQAPTYWTWVADSVAAEQARRRGDPRPLSAPPGMPPLSAEELLVAAHSMVAASTAMQNLDMLTPRPLRADEEQTRDEFLRLFRAHSEALVLMAETGVSH